MKGKGLKLITEILAIIVICLVAFVGVYVQKNNKIENQVKKYQYTKDLLGYREVIFELSDAVQVLNSEGKVVGTTDSYSDSQIESNSYQKSETKVNSEESLSEENYKKAKKIIEERLNKLNVTDYNLSIDNSNGKMYLQLPENEETDHTLSNILQISKFQIKDSEDNSKVYITNNDLKEVKAVYNTTEAGTTVYLQIELNKNGKEVLKDISSEEYATKEEASDENNENDTENTENENDVEAEANVTSEENKTEENNDNEEKNEESAENSEEKEDEKDSQKKIILSIDDNEVITTSFDEPIDNGIINLSMNKATTDNESISNSLQSTSTIALLLNSGEMPLTYKVTENQYVSSNLSEKDIKNTIYKLLIAFIIIVSLYFIAKYKVKGIIATIAYVGFIGLYSLIVKYTNVQVSLESIVATFVILIMNFTIVKSLLSIKEEDSELRAKEYAKVFVRNIQKNIPLLLIAVIFSFTKLTVVSTFGMFIFWGVVFSIIYNYILTRDMLN